MPLYRYEAIDSKGKNISGTLLAQDESNLEEKLKLLGVWLIEASEAERAAASTRFSIPLLGRRRFSRRELIEFCTIMAFQTKVGIPVLQALDVAKLNCKDPHFRRVLDNMYRDIEGGFLFYETLERYPRAFPPQFVSVIKAGETSSRLPEALDDLRKYLEWLDQIVADIRQASLYPAIVLVVMAGFCLFLFSYIIPKFVTLLRSVNVKVPLITQIVFGISDIVKSTWWMWLLGLIFLVVGIPIGRRVSKTFAMAVDRLKLNLPIFGELNLMLAISRFTHNLALLYRSGIPIITALSLCIDLVDSAVVEKAVAKVVEDVKAGSIISEAMGRHKIFPSLLLRMVRMGETTGKLDDALENVSNYYNDIIPRRIKKVFTVFEPMMTLFLIFLLGAVALSIYLPILSLMGAAQQ